MQIRDTYLCCLVLRSLYTRKDGHGTYHISSNRMTISATIQHPYVEIVQLL